MQSSRRMLHGGRLVKEQRKVLYLQLYHSVLQTLENREHSTRPTAIVTPTRVFCTAACAGPSMDLPTGSKLQIIYIHEDVI